jgi:hypothetical protein
VYVNGLGIAPMVADKRVNIANLDLLEEALLKGTVRITETSERSKPFLASNERGVPHCELQGSPR